MLISLSGHVSVQKKQEQKAPDRDAIVRATASLPSCNMDRAVVQTSMRDVSAAEATPPARHHGKGWGAVVVPVGAQPRSPYESWGSRVKGGGILCTFCNFPVVLRFFEVRSFESCLKAGLEGRMLWGNVSFLSRVWQKPGLTSDGALCYSVTLLWKAVCEGAECSWGSQGHAHTWVRLLGRIGATPTLSVPVLSEDCHEPCSSKAAASFRTASRESVLAGALNSGTMCVFGLCGVSRMVAEAACGTKGTADSQSYPCTGPGEGCSHSIPAAPLLWSRSWTGFSRRCLGGRLAARETGRVCSPWAACPQLLAFSTGQGMSPTFSVSPVARLSAQPRSEPSETCSPALPPSASSVGLRLLSEEQRSLAR